MLFNDCKIIDWENIQFQKIWFNRHVIKKAMLSKLD